MVPAAGRHPADPSHGKSYTLPGMATHQDNRPLTGWPPLYFLRGVQRAGCIRVRLCVILQDNYPPVIHKLATSVVRS